MTDIEARDRREIEAWASLPHTLYEGHDCIRCRVSRYLRAAEAELRDMGDRLHGAGFEDAILLAEAVKPFERRADAAEAREKALREALTRLHNRAMAAGKGFPDHGADCDAGSCYVSAALAEPTEAER